MIRRFNRVETKYLLPRSSCERIMSELDGVLSPDEHGGRAGYPVVSLYYDSPSLGTFWAKRDDFPARRRLRLRIYPEPILEMTMQAMVEIKARTRDDVHKRRLALPLADAEQLCAGMLADDQIAASDRELAAEVRSLVVGAHLRPTAITAYHRVAFVGGAQAPGLRITFDSELRGRVHGLKIDRAVQNHPIVGAAWCVMEVKSDAAHPAWVCALLDRHGCQSQRISKYCAVVSRLSGGALPPRVMVQPLSSDEGTRRAPER